MFPFGYGKHACPGRFFANQEFKVILVQLIMSYDLRLHGAGPGNQERPPNF